MASCASGGDPIPLTLQDICLDGFYCPNNTANHPPQLCPPTPECLLNKLQMEHNVCPSSQGIYEPSACQAGHYCPPGGREQIRCPAGHYCPLGARRPVQCLALSYCPEGSGREVPFLGILCCALIDLALVILTVWPRLRKRVSRRPWREKSDARVETGLEMQSAGLLSGAYLCGLEGDGTDCDDADDQYDERSSAGLQIEFRDVIVRNPQTGGTILDGVSGVAAQASLLGVLGPSGSGKTTLVHVLTGRVKATSASVLWDGVEQDLTQPRATRGLVKFVAQDDVVHPNLTVWENVLHSARIHLGGSRTNREIARHTQRVIDRLQLTGVRNSIVGDGHRRGVSGGERKRVSIALELAALSIIQLLKRLTTKGITVICVIHQPRVEIFESLDAILVLQSGRSLYSGPAQGIQPHFEHLGYEFDPRHNPADVILDIAAGQLQPQIARPAKSATGGDLPKVAQGPQRLGPGRMAPWHRQVVFCFQRDVKQQARRLDLFWTEIAAGAVTGLLLGLAASEVRGQLFQGMYHPPFHFLSSAVNYFSMPNVAMFSCFCIAFSSAAPSVAVFGEEAILANRESKAGHSESAYFMAKVLSSLLRMALCALHHTSAYVVLGTPAVPFGVLLGLNYVFFYCIYGIGALIVSLTSREAAPLVCLMSTLIVSVLSGCQPRLASARRWHLTWLWYMLPGTWYAEAYISVHITPLAYLYDTQAAAQYMGYTFGRLGLDVGVALLIGTAYRMLGCLLITLRARTGWW
ncbi:P-loop containing nucleoside triphosphate hydrolase protein [Aspergillus candidus]|uniref:P-loop containing nucleoside triphosphate hydrolase protein n=1 Tax=Aspergillus candidus TaxID=41067 RepID=A0A2I2FM83_ASPCN|nr:P-loop containing nucleoside triphosphate hydrolase protein [Aspergillus candidus]PLB41743.1 P-loop containing nucleoside triphosphate hydrolase protein [Aspergillus candidus]